jgi:hypothetical protein
MISVLRLREQRKGIGTHGLVLPDAAVMDARNIEKIKSKYGGC